MSNAEPERLPIEWGVAERAFGGSSVSGDSYQVACYPQGVLVAAVDGLGHGIEACKAAQTATATLERHVGTPLADLMTQCHTALKGTRGVVVSMAYFRTDIDVIEWLGIGNVEGVLLRAGRGELHDASLPTRGGVVGFRLPPVRVHQLALLPGDTLIFATDGVAGGFHSGVHRDQAVQTLADDILERHGRLDDDALVLVARYWGRP